MKPLKIMIKQFASSVMKSLSIAITQNQIYDKQTLQIMKRVCKPNSNCVDVGCHKGEILQSILKAAPNGTHYAFEPLPDFYEGLIQKFPSNCKIYNVGLSNEPGEATFNYVISNPAYSGFVKRKYDRPNEKDTTITVQTELLDNIIPAGEKIDFMKVDVEGAEMQVFEGAVRVLSESRPVLVFESGIGGTDHYGTRPEQIYDLLHDECGLEVSLMANFLSGRPAFSKQDFVYQFENHLNYYFCAYPAEKA